MIVLEENGDYAAVDMETGEVEGKYKDLFRRGVLCEGRME